jgi:tetratricopeptide (TPR) repeat protein
LTIVVALFALRSVTYAVRWNDRPHFYASSLQDQPESIRLHILLAGEYRIRGELDRAAAVAEAGSRLAPEYWDIWKQRAQIAMDQRDFDRAEEYLSHAVRIRPEISVDALELLAQLRKTTRPTSNPKP